jgi:hypothetical protein
LVSNLGGFVKFVSCRNKSKNIRVRQGYGAADEHQQEGEETFAQRKLDIVVEHFV